MLTLKTSSATPDNALQMLIESLPPATQEILGIAAIPHWLDHDLADVLWPGRAEASLQEVRRFHFTHESAPGQWELHALARRYLLETWKTREPGTFREINRALSDELMRRVTAGTDQSLNNAIEALYHAMAADPATGMRQTSNLFHELLASWQMGPAERLNRLAREQEGWLNGEARFLDYFAARLAFTRYEKLEPQRVADLEQLAGDRPDSLLAACIFRLLGQNAIWQRKWEIGRQYLTDSLRISQRAKDLESQALTNVALGDLFFQMVENSGGILVQSRDFAGPWHVFLYILTHAPLIVYRVLSTWINWLPNFYGSSYQNWVAIHILRDALNCYRAARRLFRKLNNQRGLVEIDACMARVLLALGYPATARRLSEASLKNPLVAASPYDTARLQAVIGQVEHENGQLELAGEHLQNSLSIFTAYGDYERAAKTARGLGLLREQEGKWMPAVTAYAACLDAARRSSELLLETEVCRRLELIITSDTEETDSKKALPLPAEKAPGQADEAEARQFAAGLCSGTQRTAYIDRYPGPVQRSFQKLSQWLAFPLMFLFIVFIIAASGVAIQVVEGELRGNLPPIRWADVPGLAVALLLPVFTIWLYYVLYFILGQLVVFSMSFSRVDAASPDTYELDERGITRTGRREEPVRTLLWEEVKSVVIDDRSLYRRPMTFSARVLLHDGGKPLHLPASIFGWEDMKADIQRRLAALDLHPRMEHIQLSILRTRWLWISLIVGLALAGLIQSGLMGPPQYGCYMDLSQADFSECPEQYRLYIQLWAQMGLFFAILIFLIASAIRWQGANRLSRWAHDGQASHTAK